MEHVQNPSLWIAFVAGLFTFASPCVLPFVPGYLSYMVGMSIYDMQHREKGYMRRLAALHAISFILGFSIIFICLGVSATLIGEALAQYRPIIRKIGGVIVIVFGLHLTGIFKLKFLSAKKAFTLKERKSITLAGSVLAGIIFAFAWTPCVGPILASILLYAGASDTLGLGIPLLIAYSLGLGIPFFACSLAINWILSHFGRLGRFLAVTSVVGGIFLICLGVLLVTDYLYLLSGWFAFLGGR